MMTFADSISLLRTFWLLLMETSLLWLISCTLEVCTKEQNSRPVHLLSGWKTQFVMPIWRGARFATNTKALVGSKVRLVFLCKEDHKSDGISGTKSHWLFPAVHHLWVLDFALVSCLWGADLGLFQEVSVAVMCNSPPVSMNGSPWSLEAEAFLTCKEALVFPCMLLPWQAPAATAPQAGEVVMACVCSDGSPHTERCCDAGVRHGCQSEREEKLLRLFWEGEIAECYSKTVGSIKGEMLWTEEREERQKMKLRVL